MVEGGFEVTDISVEQIPAFVKAFRGVSERRQGTGHDDSRQQLQRADPRALE
jgi:hypothetical protein